MALAVTHVLVAIVILDLVRHYIVGLKKFPRWLIVVGGIAGLGPDIDIPLGWLFRGLTGTTIDIHGIFTHSFFFVFLFLLIGLIRKYQNDKLWAKIFYVLSASWFIHLFLDWLFGEVKGLFWPWLTPATIFPPWNLYQYSIEIDAILLVLWLVHEEVQKKVKDYF